jgi:hypothetical protein
MTRAPSRQLSTGIFLPPGLVPGAKVREVLQLCLESYGWMKPVRYKDDWGWNPITRKRPFLNEVIERYERTGSLMLAGRTERQGLSMFSLPIYGGKLSCWWPDDKLARSISSREEHVQQVARMMRLLDSPLAYSAIREDEARKTCWEMEGRFIRRSEFITDYSQGLMGVFWRTFLGPPFVRLFGDHLATLPPDSARRLGSDLWFIEPYLMPADALTEEGRLKERRIIQHLGAECFFDFERQTRPTRKPELPPLDVEAVLREHKLRSYEREYGKGSERVAILLKLDEFNAWDDRHWNDEPPWFRSKVTGWAYAHQNDPALLGSTPEQIAERLRAQPKD